MKEKRVVIVRRLRRWQTESNTRGEIIDRPGCFKSEKYN